MEIILNPKKEQWAEICKRPVFDTNKLQSLCIEVFDQVKRFNDEALKRYTEQFDKVFIESFELTKEEISTAVDLVDSRLKEAINLAYSNIFKFHKAQELKNSKTITSSGVECWQESRPIEKVGIYIPGGSAPLFSTVLMLAIPAKIAGCKEIILCSPPDKNGRISNEIVFAANLCGVSRIFKLGGIQAIAAMSIGTPSVPQVYKIFGPGNQYVTAAKQYAQQLGISIDLPAGPSEVLVLADQTAIPEFAASDLLSQAEHGADSQVIFVSTNKEILEEVNNEVYRQLEKLSRKEIAKKAIDSSKLIFLQTDADCLEFINEYAPEHLILSVQNYDFYVNGLINAGSVFIGNYSPESAGDYASGTNHTLPTNAYAKTYSGTNLDSFIKKITFQKISREGLEIIGPSIETMAEAEGLQAHKNAVSIRLKRK